MKQIELGYFVRITNGDVSHQQNKYNKDQQTYKVIYTYFREQKNSNQANELTTVYHMYSDNPRIECQLYPRQSSTHVVRVSSLNCCGYYIS